MIHIVEHYVVKLLLEEYFKWRKKNCPRKMNNGRLFPRWRARMKDCPVVYSKQMNKKKMLVKVI